jgi:Zn-dependent protease with chaperone function
VHEIRGVLHDGSTSRRRDATLRFYAEGTVRLRVDGEERSLSFQELTIPSRLGNTPRRIHLPDGGELEVMDNDAVDAVLDVYGRRGHDWLHRLESRLLAVLVATAVVLGAGALFLWYGVPAIARHAAFAVSPQLASHIGEGTLDVLDQSFEPSQLPEARQAALRQAFAGIVDQAEAGYAYRLEFRRGRMIGANAFALPSGAVVVTDELVALAENDEEIVAVLAHEVGHVVYRHGLRQAIQSSMLAIAIVLVTGDLSSTSGFVAALPTLLAETHFSRDFEREADEYAARYLATRDIDACRLGALLERMQEASGGGVEVPFLSTHPSTRERIQALGGTCS